MGVSHVFQIVQMVPNRTKYRIFPDTCYRDQMLTILPHTIFVDLHQITSC